VNCVSREKSRRGIECLDGTSELADKVYLVPCFDGILIVVGPYPTDSIMSGDTRKHRHTGKSSPRPSAPGQTPNFDPLSDLGTLERHSHLFKQAGGIL